VAGRAGRAFRSAAATLHHNKSHLGSFYRRMALRKGSFAAIKAAARKLSVIFWNMMMSGEAYRTETAASYEENQKRILLSRLQKQAKRLGMTLQMAEL